MGLGDLLGLVPIVIFILIALRQVFARVNQGGAPQPPGRGARPGRPAPPRAAGPAGGGQNPRDEVEAFLRRVAERRAEAEGRPAPVAERKPAAPPPRRPQPPRQRPRPQAPPPVQVVEAETVQPLGQGESVVEHVTGHLGGGDMQRRFEQRSEIDDADDKMAAHVHEALDHRLGSLGRTAPAGKPTAIAPAVEAREAIVRTATSGAGFSALLANRDSLRQAILISEILRRPTERW